ncbi:MAG: MobF family relaxase [Marmoricola sp.]
MMTVHKLSAGDGYTYLTRQVASADQRRRRGQSLSEYYVDAGNPPGVWLGKGAAQLKLSGSEVTESQMRALFGRGLHPDGVSKLGAAYPNYAELAPYADRVAARIEWFALENGRPPSEAARNRIAALEARRGRRAVAGYDLVFTPVKSASLLWALGGSEVREAVEGAHHEAVQNTLCWLEEHAAYTRTGRGGTAQIDATGLVCAAFDHRESRAGDPDLHTHVAVANKVCGIDGKWRSLDARILYAIGVAASERYNTRFEDALARRLGVRFVDREGGRSDRRPVREVEGVPNELIGHFSSRRAAIEDRYSELRSQYRSAHGREPDHATQLRLAQQATLETREGKGPGRALTDQIDDWMHQARGLIGNRRFARFVRDCAGKVQQVRRPSTTEITALAAQVVRHVSEQRSTWTVWNIHAETERVLRSVRLASKGERETLTRAVVERATSPDLSIRIREPEVIAEPSALIRQSDGESVFIGHGSDRYTSGDMLLAEDRLVAAALVPGGPHMELLVLDAAVAAHQTRSKVRLDRGQRALVEAFAIGPARIVVGIGPAGAGKTTAMMAFANAWQSNGGRVIPLATSSRAAQVLGTELGVRAENLHKFLYEVKRANVDSDDWFRLGEGDVVLVDEAGMAGTLQLAELLDFAANAGAAVRLLGDPAQLAAVDAGGALRLLEIEAGATHLTDLHRFVDPAEADATLQLRSGDLRAIEFYEANDRVQSGSRDAMLEAAYAGWARDVRSGRHSVLVAATGEDVCALNARARTERVVAGQVASGGALLRDGNVAGAGDWIVTRANERTLLYGKTRWVHNGDTWQVVRGHRDGSMTVQHLGNRRRVRLPAAYVETDVELAYACTAHRAQGSTTDTAHALVTPEMTRESLYVASTRGREHTTWYAATETYLSADCDHEPESPRTAREVLTTILRRSGAEDSASSAIRSTVELASELPTLVARYEHARDVAALEMLNQSLAKLPVADRDRLRTDKGAPKLARVLANAAARGADPGQLLVGAYELESRKNTGAPAAVIASRIEDNPRTLGVPDVQPNDRPLPWLPAPAVGHAAWDTYLRDRAELIANRARELGGLAPAYREQYGVTTDDPRDLGPPPAPGDPRTAAYDVALGSIADRTRPTSPAPANSPIPRQRADAREPHRQLTR